MRIAKQTWYEGHDGNEDEASSHAGMTYEDEDSAPNPVHESYGRKGARQIDASHDNASQHRGTQASLLKNLAEPQSSMRVAVK